MPKQKLFSWLYTPLKPISEWWLARIIVDESGDPSAKRTMGLAAGFALIFSMVWNTMHPATKINDKLIEGLVWICIGCLGLSTADKFSPTAKILTTAHVQTTNVVSPDPQEPEIK